MATVNYTVRPGDTLWNIAEKFDTSVNDIARYNGISDVNQIYPGQVLRIATQFPVASKWYIVRQGDTLSSIADRYNTTVERLLQLNCCNLRPQPDLSRTGTEGQAIASCHSSPQLTGVA